MSEKWRLIVVIICVIAVTICVTTAVVLCLTNKNDVAQVDPYADIRVKNKEYLTTINSLLNETQNAILTFENTNNMTYLAYAVQVFDITLNEQLEYHSWFTYNVSKEIDDRELDSKIFDDVYIMEFKVDSMMMNLWLVESEVL